MHLKRDTNFHPKTAIFSHCYTAFWSCNEAFHSVLTDDYWKTKLHTFLIQMFSENVFLRTTRSCEKMSHLKKKKSSYVLSHPWIMNHIQQKNDCNCPCHHQVNSSVNQFFKVWMCCPNIFTVLINKPDQILHKIIKIGNVYSAYEFKPQTTHKKVYDVIVMFII